MCKWTVGHPLPTVHRHDRHIEEGQLQAQPEQPSLVGGHGLYFDTPYSDILNDIKVLKVAGGSNEIMRNFIARRVLKDPGHEGLA